MAMNPSERLRDNRRTTFNVKSRRSFFNESTNSMSFRRLATVIHNNSTVKPYNKKLLKWINKKNALKKNEPNLKTIIDLSYDQIKQKYLFLSHAMMAIDLFCLVFNIIVISLSYVSYYEIVRAKWKLTPRCNALRLSSMILSLIVCSAIIVQTFIKKKVKLLKYIFNIRLSYPKRSINYFSLFPQLILHLILPYPFITSSYPMLFNKRRLTFSIDKVLLFITFFRLYFIMRIVASFTSNRMMLLWKSLQNTNLPFFLYKIFNKKHPMAFSLFKIIALILFSATCLCFMENFTTKANFWVTLRFIHRAVFSRGDSHDIPQTIEGQIIVALTIFLGIYLTTDLNYKIIEFFMLSKDNEAKAYHQIQLSSLKESKSNPYHIYFEHYFKYKRSKMLSKSCFEILHLKNKFKLIKEKYFSQVLATLRVDYTPSDLVNYVKGIYDPQMDKGIGHLRETIGCLFDYQDYFTETLFDYYKSVSGLYHFTNQLANLIQLTFWTGGRFQCDDFSRLLKYKVIDLKAFDSRLKEFCIYFEGNKESQMKNSGSPLKTKRTIHLNKKKAMQMCSINRLSSNDEMSPMKIAFSSESNEEEEMSSCSLLGEELNEYAEYEDHDSVRDERNDM